MNTAQRRQWDIFCRVIDNFGDIGVSWRLARQLVSEHGLTVRLWVDQLASLQALCPPVDAGARRQIVNGVEVLLCDDAADFSQPAAVVVEAFGCGLPPSYVAAMAAMAAMAGHDAKPLWIILEYLSAEPWVREHHGLPSPHPQLNLPRYFFFPGFSEGTGGVLREADLLARRDAFDAHAHQQWWTQWGYDDVPQKTLTVSLFAYPTAPFAALIEACAQSAVPVVMVIPAAPLALRVREYLHCATANQTRRDNLEVRFVPFVPQADYDALLWACNVNFVRGEDSFVRAQWSGRPLVWHIYPQAQHAHALKLNAFLDRYGSVLPAPAAAAVRGLWHAWNGSADAPTLGEAWPAFVRELPAQRQGLRRWQDSVLGIGDMAGNLVNFCQKLI